tara:strand:+ start:411 stop:965 length:555 start_codon:yes stop_codon:yes gene_type:complete
MFKKMSFLKYRWKCRLLVVETPNYNNQFYNETKKIYQKKIKLFHKQYIKIVTILKKNKPFNIILIDIDGKIKKKFKRLNKKSNIKYFEKMEKIEKNDNDKLKLINLSLFSDYNPKTTTFGLGFKDKKKAIFTLNHIKNRKKKYQINVVSTMMGRAKRHPNQTRGMREAILVFKNWMKNYYKNKR